MPVDFSKYGQPLQEQKTTSDFSKYGVPAAPPLTTLQNQTEPGYLERVGDAFARAGSSITDDIQAGARALEANSGSLPDQLKATGALLRTGLRTTGSTAGAAFSPITEAPVIRDVIGGLAGLIAQVPGVKDIAENAAQLAEQHPEYAKDIEAIANIAFLGAPSTKGVQKVGQAVSVNAAGAAQKGKEKFVRELLTPEQTKAVKEAQVSRTTETGVGPLKRSVVQPTQSQLRSEREVLAIPGVSRDKTVQQNYNVIKEANFAEAENLKAQIAANDFIIPRRETASRLDAAAKTLENSPLIVGDAEKTAQRLLEGARQAIDENSGTGSGLLQARKDYDAWVQTQKPNAFDARAENAFSIANREIRRAFNDLLDEKATNVQVKQSLSRQNALYNALETLTPKAAQEADTAIGRVFQKMVNALGVKNKIVQGMATIAGIGGLGAAAAFAPAVAISTVPTYLAYRAGRFALKPEVRRSIGELLEKAGPALEKADRALLQGILEEYGDDEE